MPRCTGLGRHSRGAKQKQGTNDGGLRVARNAAALKARKAAARNRPPKCPETAALIAAKYEELDPESEWTDSEVES